MVLAGIRPAVTLLGGTGLPGTPQWQKEGGAWEESLLGLC